MKSSGIKLLYAGLALGLTALPTAHAQRQLGKKKGPTSKVYLAEAKGESQVVTGDKVYAAKQATAFDAPGTIIETTGDSHNAFVYSNGSAMYVDENTRVEIDRFVQEPFQPDRNTTEIEPSISQSDIFVAHGFVGICTSQLVSGSTMTYSTPHAAINIRGKKVGIRSEPDETTIYLIEGDITVRSGGRDLGGQLLRPGEQAVIRPGLPGQAPRVDIGPISQEMMQAVDDRVNVACNARKTVTFETIEKKAEFGAAGDPAEIVDAGTGTSAGQSASTGDTGESTQEIVAVPTVTETPPSNIVVSPDRLPGNG